MFKNDFVAKLMSRNKFEQMLVNFRYEDTAGMTEREKRAKSDEDAFWTVAAFLTRVSDNFLEQYSPYQDVSIDEMCFPFKGRHSIDDIIKISQTNIILSSMGSAVPAPSAC